MTLEIQVLAAVLLDLALGDPRWLPHPVRGMGWLADRLEPLGRRAIGNERAAGFVVALTVYALCGVLAWGAIALATRVHPAAGWAVSIVLIYTTIAARDLARHSRAVWQALAQNDLAEARRRVGQIVGRDTAGLDAAGVVRAAVESVAESTVDGVTAPLFFALLCGPVGAVVYRAINTLDSMFGHQDQRYARFGWAAARIDDAANYLPARLTAPLICLAAGLLGQRPRAAWHICLRDGRKHASPNSGLTEAAMAGALGVQLGGRVEYDGQPLDKPLIGEPRVPLAAPHIRTANALMFTAAGLFLATGIALRTAVVAGAAVVAGLRPSHSANRRCPAPPEQKPFCTLQFALCNLHSSSVSPPCDLPTPADRLGRAAP